MSSVYRGRLRNPSDASIDLPVSLIFDRHQLHVTSDGRSLGWWPLKRVWAERREANLFVLSIEGEFWHFLADQPAEFLTQGIPQLSSQHPSDRLHKRRSRIASATLILAYWAMASVTTLMAFAGGVLLGRYQLDGNVAVTSGSIGVLLAVSLFWARSMQRAARARPATSDKVHRRSPVRVSQAVAGQASAAREQRAADARRTSTTAPRLPTPIRTPKTESKPALAQVSSALSETEAVAPGGGTTERVQSISVRLEPPIDPSVVVGPPPPSEVIERDLTGEAPVATPVTGYPIPEGPTDQISGADLQLSTIKGIGPVFADWLFELGIHSVGELARLDDEGVDRMIEKMGRFGRRIRAEDWVGQARQLLGMEPAAHD